MRKYQMVHLSNLSPTLPGMTGPKTYAAWPVWKDSTMATVKFTPLPKKQAAKIWHKARRFDRQTHQPGRHGGIIGRSALSVLYTLLFEFLNYESGRLDPSYEGIAQKAGLCRRSVAEALKRLKALGIIHWLRRCVEDVTDGGFRLRQKTNAYAILPPRQWPGYAELPEDLPHLGEWGAALPLPSMVDQAVADWKGGAGMASGLSCLEADPHDPLALLLARFGRSLLAKPLAKPLD